MREDLSIKDFEQAVDNAVAHLYIMYKNNGGDEAKKTLTVLLKNIHRITPYLDNLTQAAINVTGTAEGSKELLVQLQPILDVLKEEGNTSDGNRTK